MNIVSPVSTANGSGSVARSHTTMLIDSGVCPGVWRTSRTTSPSSMRSPSASLRDSNSVSATEP